MSSAACGVLNNLGFLPMMRLALVNSESIHDFTPDKNLKRKLVHVRKIAEVVARDIITNFRDTHFDSFPPNKYCELMRKVTLEVYSKYVITINHNVEIIFEEVKKQDTTGYTIVDAFNGVVMSMLEDETNFHWGRVSMIFTLAAVMAHICRKKTQDYSEKLIKQIIEIFQQKKIDEWILQNGGWDSFADNFQSHNYEAKIKRTLYMTALGLGALASLTATI